MASNGGTCLYSSVNKMSNILTASIFTQQLSTFPRTLYYLRLRLAMVPQNHCYLYEIYVTYSEQLNCL